jgi:hypothetical protein
MRRIAIASAPLLLVVLPAATTTGATRTSLMSFGQSADALVM